MKVVYSASNIALASLFKHILESHGIKCWIRNEFLSAATGEIPPIESWPQLCVDDADFETASPIVEEALSSGNEGAEDWKCGSCGEENEGQFTECWNCGNSCPEATSGVEPLSDSVTD